MSIVFIRIITFVRINCIGLRQRLIVVFIFIGSVEFDEQLLMIYHSETPVTGLR